MSDAKIAAEAAETLDAHPDYRVLRRLNPPPYRVITPGEPVRWGLFIDTETTGLLQGIDTVIELSMVPFAYDAGDKLIGVGNVYHSFNDPGRPLTAEIVELTGITDAMVKGAKINVEEVDEILKGFKLCAAHNAEFDRPFVEAISPAFAQKAWACSMTQVPWSDFGIGSRKLDYIAQRLGLFFEAHRATDDCLAALGLLNVEMTDRGGSKSTGMELMLFNARKKTVRVWAIAAPFDSKDKLKARGYKWNTGDDGRPKAWSKEIEDTKEHREDEMAFLGGHVYHIPEPTEAQWNPVAITDRFTSRG